MPLKTNFKVGEEWLTLEESPILKIWAEVVDKAFEDYIFNKESREHTCNIMGLPECKNPDCNDGE